MSLRTRSFNSCKFRKGVSDINLANGGSRDELGMVKEFLVREPNHDAFFKFIGLDDKE
jgi:Zn-dependent oligopeptidase